MRVFLLLNTESRFSVLSVHLLLLYSVKISVSWNDAYPPPPQCLSRLILFLLIWPQLLPLWLLSSEQFYVRQSLNLWTNAFSSAPGWFSASFWMSRETNWQKMPGWPNRPQIWFRDLLLSKMAPINVFASTRIGSTLKLLPFEKESCYEISSIIRA